MQGLGGASLPARFRPNVTMPGRRVGLQCIHVHFQLARRRIRENGSFIVTINCQLPSMRERMREAREREKKIETFFGTSGIFWNFPALAHNKLPVQWQQHLITRRCSEERISDGMGSSSYVTKNFFRSSPLPETLRLNLGCQSVHCDQFISFPLNQVMRSHPTRPMN